MADALAGLAVFAVELPGHDLAAEREPFATIGETVARVVAELDTELAKRGLARVMLWGHSAGTALAVATARALHERGIEVARLFLAAQLPRDATERRAAADRLLARGTRRSPPGSRATASSPRSRPSTSARRTGTTAWPRTATSPTCWTPHRPRCPSP